MFSKSISYFSIKVNPSSYFSVLPLLLLSPDWFSGARFGTFPNGKVPNGNHGPNAVVMNEKENDSSFCRPECRKSEDFLYDETRRDEEEEKEEKEEREKEKERERKKEKRRRNRASEQESERETSY